MRRPLTELTDAELAKLLEDMSKTVVPSYNGIVSEMDRRDAKRAAAANERLARRAIIIATLSLVVSALGILAQLLK